MSISAKKVPIPSSGGTTSCFDLALAAFGRTLREGASRYEVRIGGDHGKADVVREVA